MRRLPAVATSLTLVLTAACTDTPAATAPELDPQLASSAASGVWKPDPAVQAAAESAIRDLASELSAEFGRGVAEPLKAEWLAAPGGQAMGTEILFRDVGNRQIGIKYVPGDPRRQGRTDIRYGVLPSAPAGLDPADVEAAIDRAMSTWNHQTCSSGLDIGKVSFSDITADIVHFGFLPLPPPILGVTFPFIWVNPDGEPTDIDNDGALDYAFALILYSSSFPWAIDGNIDVETVALHEAGHGLGQDHFGTLFQTLQNGQFHFSPRALMNAGYTGVQQGLSGTDAAGHCGLWGSWPSN